MKDFRLLVWLTQLGLSLVIPLAGFVLLGVWLHRSLSWGTWTVWAGLVLGIACAIQGFRDSLKALERMSINCQNQEPPPLSFQDHL